MAERKSRLTKPLEEWEAADVLALVEERVEEGQRLEFKRQLNLDTTKQRSEACKDASGLGNSQGGLLVYGVQEEEQDDGRRIPTRATPLNDGDARSRLEDILDSAVHPPLNMETRQIETDGGYFLVLRVFPRLGAPHMVDGYGEMRFYVRAGLKTRPMSQREIEAAFAEAARSEALAGERLARLELAVLPEGVERESTARGANRAPGPWLGVLTVPIDAPDPLLPMQKADSRAFPDDGAYGRWSHSDLGLTLNWDAEGYHGDLYDEDKLTRRLRLFRNGTFEWGTTLASRAESIPSLSIAQYIHDVLGYFAISYRRAGYFGRVRAWIAIEAGVGSKLGLDSGYLGFDLKPLSNAHLEWRGDYSVDGLLDDLAGATRGAMDRIFVAYGLASCFYFDAEGAPVGELCRGS
ncbi:MAG TPA: ATP-binding protein [Solirubrobacterales bacterium]|nr:ATP-binding protein [Solirubrobacterales bacterium]